MKSKRAQLIVALDVDTLQEARDLIDQLSPVVDIFKVGSQLFTACGPAAVRFIMARGKKVFLDLKFHDIPNTVARAVRSAVNLSNVVNTPLDEEGKELPKVSNEGLFMYTLHTQGGVEMMNAAVSAGAEMAEELQVTKPLTVGVTVLTSKQKGDNIQNLVLQRSLIAREAGLDGVVASAQEAQAIRREMGKDFIIVTPGIRPQGEGVNDQKRVTTPKDAVAQGSNYLVIGRLIIQSKNPLESAKNILKEIE